MGGNPDWIFYHDDKPSEAEVMPRLIADFPGFRPRWEKHLELWKGKPAGSYNDIAEFAHVVVDDLYPNGNTADLQRVFDLMEQWLVNGNQNLRDRGRRLEKRRSFRFSNCNRIS
jgi:Zn-dependent M32 family carboxypeptidase